MSELRKQIEEEIALVKRDIEKLKVLAKKRIGQPNDLEDVTYRLRELYERLSTLQRNLLTK